MSRLSSNTIFAGRYKLIDQLGIGGYSEVWKAADNMAGEMLVALKIFAPDKGMDQSGIQIFSKEYGLLFNLNHPNLLKPSHYDIWEGSPYLVMSYCAGGSLYGKLGEMSEMEILFFIRQACSALFYLHTQPTPIIHQDIKPDNFLIDEKGNFLLSDFGISSRLRRTLSRSVGIASSAGTLAYMPPERFSKQQQISPASDIFSLGVTIFEILTERQPFGEQGGLLLKSGAEIPDLPQKFSTCLNELVASCLNADPTLRPDASTLEIKAEDLLQSLKSESVKPSIERALPDSRKTVKIPELPEVQPSKSSASNSLKWVTWILVTSVILFAIIVDITKISTSPSDEEIRAKDIADSIALEESLAYQQAKLDSLIYVATKVKVDDSQQANVDSKSKESVITPPKPSQKEILDNMQVAEVYKEKSRLEIGQNYAGGIIFFIDETKQHGLVCAPYDQESSIKWCPGYTTTNATSEFIGDGSFNTSKIVASVGYGWYAAIICDNLSLNGFSDWYLPSSGELNLLYKNLQLQVIGGFKKDYYWSSTEKDKQNAYYQSFDNGCQFYSFKHRTQRVRAIRAF